MKKLWYILVPVVAAGLLSWGAYVNITVEAALPEEKFEEHEKENNSQFTDLLKEIQRQRESIEEKLDEIQEKL